MPEKTQRLTAALIKKVVAKLVLGNYRVTAFALVDVPQRTWKRWIHDGRALRDDDDAEVKTQHQRLLVELITKVERAEAQAMSSCVEDVATSDDDRVKMTFLERRWGKYFSRNPNAIIDEETGEETELVPRDILADKIAAIVAKRLKGEG